MILKTLKLSRLAFLSTSLALALAGQATAQVASPGVVITELNGQQVFEGDGGYDQIDYDGNSANYAFIRNADFSVSVTKPDGVTDRLINIDGFWFAGEQQWYAIEDLEVPASEGQTITGSPGRYDQVDYPGNSGEYVFVRNADMSISVSKPGGAIDTLIDIDGIWFSGEFEWYAIGDLITPSNGGRTITGGPDYDQVDYPGDSSDYTFSENTNGSVSVDKPDGSTDILTSIEGFWFQGEQAWYPIESLLPQTGQTIIGTNAYDQVDYDGFRSEYLFVQNANGTVTVNRPGGLIDTLTSIDGFWFRGEEAWYSIEDIFDGDTGTLIDGVITGSHDVNDNLTGTSATDVFFAGRGNDLIRGLGGQDTLRVDGDVYEWTYTADGDTLTMTHPTWGVNTLISIERIFSLRSGQNFTVNQAIASTNGLPTFRLDGDNVINGTPGNDIIPAQTGVQGFYGGLGNDTYQGTGNFEQVNYDGARAEYTFRQNANGSIRVTHPIWGTDTLVDIDGLIFTGVEPGVGGNRTAEFEYVNIGDVVG
ncbi:MAG: hypothetical protein ABJO36_08585 [Litorimonas sp.]